MKYRIATVSDCEALTDIRMRMRKEPGFYSGIDLCGNFGFF